jgi:hypothetical protein
MNDIDQENGETSVHQENYTFRHVGIDKQFTYFVQFTVRQF